MPVNLENSAVATGLEKISFHSNPKEGKYQRMFKLLHNCTHFTCQQGNTQNPSSQVSAVCELRTSRCTSWIQKRQRSNCQNLLDHRQSQYQQCLVTQSCPTFCYPMDCSFPGSSVHRILQARILEWTAIPLSRGSF